MLSALVSSAITDLELVKRNEIQYLKPRSYETKFCLNLRLIKNKQNGAHVRAAALHKGLKIP